MKGLPMAPGAKATRRTEDVCPLCDQPRLTRSQAVWRQIRRWALYGWIIGLGILAAEIVIEARVIEEEWKMLERVERLMELRGGPVRGR